MFYIKEWVGRDGVWQGMWLGQILVVQRVFFRLLIFLGIRKKEYKYKRMLGWMFLIVGDSQKRNIFLELIFYILERCLVFMGRGSIKVFNKNEIWFKLRSELRKVILFLDKIDGGKSFFIQVRINW